MQITFVAWVVGIMFLTIAVFKIQWGASLILVAHATRRSPWWCILYDGALYLGWYFVLSGAIIMGGLGVRFLERPDIETPSWVAIAVMVMLTDITLAHFFLAGPGADWLEPWEDDGEPDQ